MGQDKENPHSIEDFTLSLSLHRKEVERSLLPYNPLLEEAFNELTPLLAKNGITRQFIEPWLRHSEQLLSYWQNRIDLYLEAVNNGTRPHFPHSPITIGEEKLTMMVHQPGFNMQISQPQLEIKRETPTEYQSVIIPSDESLGASVLAPLITVSSQNHRKSSGDYLQVSYGIDFQLGRIARLLKYQSTSAIETDKSLPPPYVTTQSGFDCDEFNLYYEDHK